MPTPDGEVVSRFSPDTWLAEILGRPVFRLVAVDSVDQHNPLSVEMTRLSASRNAFFYAKLPTSDVARSIALASAGFAVIDTNITFASRMRPPNSRKTAIVGLAKKDQLDAIPRIAETCFHWSRFHLDPVFGRDLANLIKRRWMESYVQGKRGSALYAADVDGVVAGFLGVLESTVNNRPVAIIDLVGVAPEYQGRGVGAALVQSFVADWEGRVSELRVGTQAANIQSLGFYEHNGFRVVESSYVLHAHHQSGGSYR